MRHIFHEISRSPRKSHFRGKANNSVIISAEIRTILFRRKLLSYGNRPPRNSFIANTLMADLLCQRTFFSCRGSTLNERINNNNNNIATRESGSKKRVYGEHNTCSSREQPRCISCTVCTPRSTARFLVMSVCACVVGTFSREYGSTGYGCQLCLWSAGEEIVYFPCPRLRLRI